MPTWWRNLLMVWIAQFLSLMGFSMGMPFVPFYIQDLGVHDPAQVKLWASLFFAAVFIPLALMAPIWGVLADRYGRKRMLLRANVAAVVVLGGMALAPNVWVLLALRLLQGFFTGTVAAAQVLVSADTPKERQGMVIGTLSGAVFSGGLAGAVVGGELADHYGYRIPFWCAAGLMLISTLMVQFLVTERFVPPVRAVDAPPRRAAWRQALVGWRPWMPLLAVIFVGGIARQFDASMFPLLVQDINGGQLEGAASWTGRIGGATAVAALISSLVMGWLSDRISPAALGRWSSLGAGLCMALIGLVHSFHWLLPLRFAMVLFGGGFDSLFQSWLARISPAHQRGTVLGLAVTARSLGWFAGPLMGGTIAMVSSVRWVYWAAPLVYLLVWPVLAYAAVRMAPLSASEPLPGGEPRGLPEAASEAAADAAVAGIAPAAVPLPDTQDEE